MFSLPLLYTFLSGVSFALLGLSYKIAARHGCRPTAFAIVFSLVAAALAAVLASFSPSTWGDTRLWGLGIVMGVLLSASILMMVYINTAGPISTSWTVLNLALVLPILISPIFFHESFLWVDALLVLCFVLTLLAFARGMSVAGSERPTHMALYISVLLLIFLFNGIFLIGQKLKSEWFGGVNSASLSAIFYGCSALVSALVYRFRDGREPLRASEWGVGTLAGIASVLGVLLFLNSLSLPSVVTFPISQGVALLGGVFLAALFYGERFNLYKSLGIGMGIIVLMLAIFREPIAAQVTRVFGV